MSRRRHLERAAIAVEHRAQHGREVLGEVDHARLVRLAQDRLRVVAL